ncbi:MAG: virulence RhuM family protein [Bacteroidota bacterium]
MKIKKSEVPSSNFSEILLYRTPAGGVKVEIFLQNETIWLTQQKIADLFGVDRSVVTKHLKNIIDTKELDRDSVCAYFAHTASDGKKYSTLFYNLDAIISVGYRVNSNQATAFRIWATERLKEYIIKGFTMDDERLKNPISIFGKDYFEEQLERIRDIRSSERRFYQKITDIYAMCSADYNIDHDLTRHFFATVQNKLHFAISGQTAAEIIYNRANSEKDHMGLTTWKNGPSGYIRKADVSIAKNYLSSKELDNLNRIVSMYLDFAELQAKNGKIMYMQNWVDRLDAFLQFNEQDILKNIGKVSAEIAKNFAETEYEKYYSSNIQNFRSDFDRLLESEVEYLLNTIKKATKNK